MLAFLVACARDSLLRAATPFVLTISPGSTVQPAAVADFSPGALRLASSWGQAGYLQGKKTKRRTHPHVAPIVTTFVLLLAYLSGLRGAHLLDSTWTRLLDCSSATLTEFTAEASK
jgi:hypothetical protein